MPARKKDTNPIKHELIPEHKKLNQKEKKALFEKHKITIQKLPKILASDPALRGLDAKPDDVIKITRKSLTAGVAIGYRGVVSG